MPKVEKPRKITREYDSVKIGKTLVFDTDYGGCCGIHEVRGFQVYPDDVYDFDGDAESSEYDTDNLENVLEVFRRSSEVDWSVNQIFLGLVTSWKYADQYQDALIEGGWNLIGEAFKNPNTGNMIEMWTYTVEKDKQTK
jgi:hypothetical protein